MKDLELTKGKVFEIKAPNGAIIKAVVLHEQDMMVSDYDDHDCHTQYTCYSQNRIFLLHEYITSDWEVDPGAGKKVLLPDQYDYEFGDTIVDYAVIEEYDILLNH